MRNRSIECHIILIKTQILIRAYILCDQSYLNDCVITDAQGGGVYKLLWLILNARKIVVLVILYALSNLLSYYALARVDASAYTVLLQVL